MNIILLMMVRTKIRFAAFFLKEKEVYPGAEVREKTHIQVCIVNLNYIKGLFSPTEMITGSQMP